MFRVYRTLDISEPNHSGNREYSGEYVSDRGAAKSAAVIMNLIEIEMNK